MRRDAPFLSGRQSHRHSLPPPPWRVNRRKWEFETRNGAQWKRWAVEWFIVGSGMERSGGGLNWRSQAPNPSRCVVAEFGGPGFKVREP